MITKETAYYTTYSYKLTEDGKDLKLKFFPGKTDLIYITKLNERPFGIDLKAFQEARLDLSFEAFYLYGYLALLSSDRIWAIDMYQANMLTSDYYKAKNELIEKHYLIASPIETFNETFTENTYFFFEKAPQSREELDELYYSDVEGE